MEEQNEENVSRWNFDSKGYLIDPATWDPALAGWLSREENVALTGEHHLVIDFLRRYYQEHTVHPVIRMITAAMSAALGPEKGTAKYFHCLFPPGSTRPSGLPGFP